MHRQSLIVGARPLLVKDKLFPRVPLGEGSWRIEVENRVSSKIRLLIEKPATTPNGNGVMKSVVEISNGDHPLFTGPIHISAEIFEPGREQYINVFAVRL